MAKPRVVRNMMASPLMDNDPDQLSPEEQAALEAEQAAAGAEPVAEPAPVEPAVVPTEPKPPAEPAVEAKPAEPAPEPPAQQRIRELVDEKKRLAEELREQQEKWARLDERRKTAQQLQDEASQAAERAKVAAQRPDPDIDPQGAMLFDVRQQNAQLAADLKQLQGQFQTVAQQTQQQFTQNNIDTWVANDVARVRSLHPDYEAARDFLRSVHITRNKLLGYNDAQCENLWNMERRAHEMQAAQNGVSIADFAYRMAQEVGYKAPEANGGGNAAPKPIVPQAIPNGRERVAQLERAQRAQGLGGKQSSAEGEPHAHIRSMNSAQFNEYLDSFGPGDAWVEAMNADPVLKRVLETKFAELG